MSGNEVDGPEIATWDPAFTKRVITVMTPVVKRWFRAEVRGLESFPSAGGALVPLTGSAASAAYLYWADRRTRGTVT